MYDETVNRRVFLRGSGTLAGGVMLRGGMPGLLALSAAACTARDEGAAFATLSTDQARDLEAVAARILPATATPGAREAGVIWFIDKVYGSIFDHAYERDMESLTQFRLALMGAHPQVEDFTGLTETQQDDFLETQERTRFFSSARYLTIAGMFSMSMWGGNRDDIGWRLIGMDGPPHGWPSPFGHYDAEYLREQEGG